MGINAHRALYSAGADDHYLGGLTVPDPERDELRGIRDDIREALKGGFAVWSKFIDREQLFEAAALLKLADQEPALRPKFRMQGSWSYHTLNCATIEPPQEIDLDDGVFLPVSFLTQNGEVHPALASSAFFQAVERILQPLCDENGWILNRDKQSCVRVEVRTGAHIDLALYAIPDQDFAELVEKVEARARDGLRDLALDEAFNTEIYPRLPADHIMLAHRQDGWKPSDPRKLEDWFQNAVNRHGSQLRRVCRYLKGWRDNIWPACRLSSIALMAAVVAAYAEVTTAPPENRDDLALKLVAERLPNFLAGRISNPVVEGQYLDEGWKPEWRTDFEGKAHVLVDSLNAALASREKEYALRTLRGVLGEYLPDNADLLQLTVDGAPAILTEGLLGELANPETQREPVKIGGERRYG